MFPKQSRNDAQKSIQFKKIKMNSQHQHGEHSPNLFNAFKQRSGDIRDRLEMTKEKFQPFRIPPDISQCYFHRTATQFGRPFERDFTQYQALKQNKFQQNNQTVNISSPQHFPTQNQKSFTCLCCGQQPKQQLSVLCRIQQIYNVNQPLGYYFTYIKTMCFMLFLIAVSVGVYAFKQIIINCQQSQENCTYIYGIPVSKFHVFFTDLLVIMNIIIILIMYVFIAYLYYNNAHIHKKMFLNHKKSSDYCVLISGVDHDKVSGQAILNNFYEYNIVNILYTHKIQSYVKKLSKKCVLEAKKNLYFRRGQDQKIRQIQQKIASIDHNLLHTKNKLNLNQQKSIRTDKIIIKFSTTQQKTRFDQQYKQRLAQTIIRSLCGGSLIRINSNKIYVQPLGQPHQIIWQNLQIKSKTRYLRVLIGNIITILVLGCSYLVILMLTKLQKDVKGASDIILAITFSIVIEATNFMLGMTIVKVTQWQRRYTLTGKTSMILIKNFTSFFLNTTLTPFSLFFFTQGTVDEDDLIRNIFTLFLVSNFVSPFISLYIQPSFIYALYKRREVMKQGKQCLQTQMKANEYFQKVDFDLTSRYCQILQRVTNSLFYAAVFPFGVMITFLGLILAYWTSKWWLIKYCSIPKFSYRLGRFINDITTTFPCIFAFGYAANIYMVPGQSQFDRQFSIFVAIATIPLSCLFFMFGNIVSQKFVSKQYEQVQNKKSIQQKMTSDQYQSQNNPDYRQLNPTTFLHSNIHIQIQANQFQNMASHLESYAFQKQASHLRRDSDLSSLKSVRQSNQIERNVMQEKK